MEMMKRAREMFLDAAAGAVFGSTCDFFLESIEKCGTLDIPVLDRVKSTVESLELCIPKMEDHDITFGDEVKEEMKRARRFLDKLSEDNDLSWSKSSDNDQLVELDASLKSLVGKLRLQLATEVLGLGKGTKRKLDEVDESVKAGFLESKTRDEVVLNKMEKLERICLGNHVGPFIEEGRLGAALGQLADVAHESSLSDWYTPRYETTKYLTSEIFGLLDADVADYTDSYRITCTEVIDFRKSIEDGVVVLRKCPEVAVWTDELKLEYTNKFLALEKTLEAIHNRLAGIRPLKRNCGTTSTQDSAINTTKDFIIHGN